MVTVIVHQVTTDFGRTRGAATAVLEAIRAAPSLPQPEVGGRRFPGCPVRPSHTDYTVIEAITVGESPEGPPNGWSGRPQDPPPRSDALMRCIRLVTDLVGRTASRAKCHAPSRRMSGSRRRCCCTWHPRYASGNVDDSHPGEYIRSTGDWGGPQITVLDHLNIPDAPIGPPVEGALEE